MKEKTYRVVVICKNCGYGSKTEEVYLTVPMGTPVQTHIATAKCGRCGCVGCFKKMDDVIKALDGH